MATGDFVAGASAREMLNTKSWAVTGSPLLKRALFRMWKNQTRWFFDSTQWSARSGIGLLLGNDSFTRLAYTIQMFEMEIESVTTAGSIVCTQSASPVSCCERSTGIACDATFPATCCEPLRLEP